MPNDDYERPFVAIGVPPVSFRSGFVSVLTFIALALTAAPLALAQCNVSGLSDQYFEPLAKNQKIRAAALIYIENGSAAQERFYGSDVSGNTLWRAASTSKALTALAVMQLVEQRRLSLDADIREFLPAGALLNPFHTPVTIRQLLMHRGGVDDRFIGDGFSGGPQPSMTDIVQAHPLSVVYEPGKIESYSNYGYALLGAAIEKASGERYEDYMQKHVLAPLGMEHSTFMQPLPAQWLSRMARGMWVYQRSAPAAALTTTADDMRQLLLATMNQDAQVVSKAGFEQMVPAAEPGVRLAHGFGYWTGNERDHPLVAASGDIEDFHNLLVVFPDLKTGFVVAISSPSNALTGNFLRAFTESCISPTLKTQATAAPAAAAVPQDDPAIPVTGLYRTTRYPHHELSKTFILFDLTRLAQRSDGHLQVGGKTYDYAGQNQFRPVNGGEPISFVTTEDNRQFMVRPGAPAMEKIRWWETGWAAVICYFAVMGYCAAGAIAGRRLTRWICSAMLVYQIGWLAIVLIVGPGNLILGLPLVLKCFLLIAYTLPALFVLSCIAALKNRSAWTITLPFAILPLAMVAWYWRLHWP